MRSNELLKTGSPNILHREKDLKLRRKVAVAGTESGRRQIEIVTVLTALRTTERESEREKYLNEKERRIAAHCF
jgi:hypothetical protein